MRVRGPETEAMHQYRIDTGFYDKYMTGKGLDIGYQGSVEDALPVLDTAVGVGMDFPGYDGVTLPFPDNSQDYVFSSHCLEHIEHWQKALWEWYRVTKIGGHIIITVPHQYLYEKKLSLPSKWNRDHKRLYTPGSLLTEIEKAYTPNSYRIRYCQDDDMCYTYHIGPESHAGGRYAITCVVQKIQEPSWRLA